MDLRSPGDLVDAQWSSDGRYLFYVLHREHANVSSLWRVDSDGAGRRRLYTDRLNSDLSAAVSPNGRWVLLQVLAGPNEELWLIGSRGHGLHPLAVPAAGADLSATAEWSPRGDRLFVIEDRTSIGPPPSPLVGPTTRVAFVIRPDGGGRHVVPYPADAATGVVWSPNERDLAYGVGSEVAITPVAGGPARTVLTAAQPFGAARPLDLGLAGNARYRTALQVPRRPAAVLTQLTAERLKVRMPRAMNAAANRTTTPRLSHASVVVLLMPQMSCRPVPRWSTNP